MSNNPILENIGSSRVCALLVGIAQEWNGHSFSFEMYYGYEIWSELIQKWKVLSPPPFNKRGITLGVALMTLKIFAQVDGGDEIPIHMCAETGSKDSHWKELKFHNQAEFNNYIEEEWRANGLNSTPFPSSKPTRVKTKQKQTDSSSWTRLTPTYLELGFTFF